MPSGGLLPSPTSSGLLDEPRDQGLLGRLADPQRWADWWQQSTFVKPGYEAMVGALMLPGNVYQGNVDPRSDEAIQRSFDLVSMAAGGPGGAGILAAGGKGGAAASGGLQGIRAYHGSPHDFERFSMEHIGSGEGAQAYGHGLYFAENPGVAHSYRDIGLTDVEHVARAYLKTAGGDARKARRLVKQRKAAAADSAVIDYDAVLQRLKDSSPMGGHMYEASIAAKPEDFLDWDKPLRDQPVFVQEAMARVLNADSRAIAGQLGQNLIARLDVGLGQTASDQLRAVGIPGIRYLDQGSRGAGEGTSNYVVFDDSIIKILKKYGIPITAGGIVAGNMLFPKKAQAAEISGGGGF